MSESLSRLFRSAGERQSVEQDDGLLLLVLGVALVNDALGAPFVTGQKRARVCWPSPALQAPDATGLVLGREMWRVVGGARRRG
jgi:hypothetical protein